jgi:hypothetical protein
MTKEHAARSLVRSWLAKVAALEKTITFGADYRRNVRTATATADQIERVDPLTELLFGSIDATDDDALEALVRQTGKRLRLQLDLVRVYARFREVREICVVLVKGRSVPEAERIHQARKVKMLAELRTFLDGRNLSERELAWLYGWPLHGDPNLRDSPRKRAIHPGNASRSLGALRITRTRFLVLWCAEPDAPYASMTRRWVDRDDVDASLLDAKHHG